MNASSPDFAHVTLRRVFSVDGMPEHLSNLVFCLPSMSWLCIRPFNQTGLVLFRRSWSTDTESQYESRLKSTFENFRRLPCSSQQQATHALPRAAIDGLEMGVYSVVSQLRVLICRASIVSKIRAIVLGAREIRPNKNESSKRGETTPPVAVSTVTTAAEIIGDSEKTELGRLRNNPAEAAHSTQQQRQSLTSSSVVQPHQPVSIRHTLARGIVHIVAGTDGKTRGARAEYRELATPPSSINSLEASDIFPRRSESSYRKDLGAQKNNAAVVTSEMPRPRSVSFNTVVKVFMHDVRGVQSSI